MIRACLISLAIFGLSACNNADDTAPVDGAQGASSTITGNDGVDAAEAIDPTRVTLTAGGLTAGPEAFYFAAGQTEVENALARALGKPVISDEMPECGAGPMEFARFSGGLTVNFQDGSLVGWNWEEGNANIAFSDALGIGTPKANVESLDGFDLIEDSTLGDEFVLGDGLAGFFADGEVTMLYSGTQCFFR